VRLASWSSDLLDLLLPAGCIACRTWIPGGREAPLVCGRCLSRLREASWPRCPRCHHPSGTGRTAREQCRECERWPEALTAARSAVVLGNPSEDLVHALKYEGWPELAGLMGAAMARVLEREPRRAGRPLLVVPVPTTAERMRSRGYNQARLLAGHVAAACGLPLHDALLRGEARGSQTRLGPTERARNVRDAFRPAPSGAADLEGADVVLVDDVLTTGATASEAASVLAGMGAAGVLLLTYARALAAGPEKGR